MEINEYPNFRPGAKVRRQSVWREGLWPYAAVVMTVCRVSGVGSGQRLTLVELERGKSFDGLPLEWLAHRFELMEEFQND